jgi:alpha-beta hydrolase superfamily lysophospholipase
MSHREGSFIGAKGLSIYFQCWEPEVAPRALILLVHGAGEHSARYAALADYLTGHGYAIASLDHPGHGRSEGTPGFVERFEDYLDTLRIFHRRVSGEYPGLPQILLGHSMGGLISCVYLLQHQGEFAGCALSGPAIMTDMEPGILQQWLLRFLSLVAPRSGAMQLDANGVSRDREVVAQYCSDPLVHHGKMSARKVTELFRKMRLVQAEAAQITLPLLVLHGGEDSMASPKGAQFLYDNAASADKTLKIYPGLYHEIFNEPEREAVFRDLLDWCEQRIATRPVAADREAPPG